jgi:hypothetical protein
MNLILTNALSSFAAAIACAGVACGDSVGPPSTSDGGGGVVSDGGSPAEGGGSEAGGSSAVGGAAPMVVDGDGDGIDDALEDDIARAYYPFFSLHPDDGCPLHGVLFRLSPHPDDASKLMIWYDVLYQDDCGVNGHVGDNELFGALIDPTLPAPAGILALRAISHQGTLCERVTTCGSLAGCAPCTTATRNGESYPVVFSSKDKHGGYVVEASCDQNVICDFGGCGVGAADDPAMVNAGEPGAPLVTDLSAQGFITPEQGWTEPGVMAYDPWGGAEFGTAGIVADDLEDAAFVIAPSGCAP